MANILREAALNYHLNPLLATMCAHEVKSNRYRLLSNRFIVYFENFKDLFNVYNTDSFGNHVD